MRPWGWERAGDSGDDPSVTCLHDWRRHALTLPLELPCSVMTVPVEPLPLHIGLICTRCGHMKLER